MRIVAGTYKGRKIQAIPNKQTRPTTDRVREAWASSIVSLLGGRGLEGLQVLDAFAGSGALGLELLSRGADTCLFVEKNRAAFDILKSNMASLELARPNVHICMADSLKNPLPAQIIQSEPFNLVILDPPYALPSVTVGEFIERLGGAGLLGKRAIISYEHASSCTESLADRKVMSTQDDATRKMQLSMEKRKVYGTTCIDYYLVNEQQ